MLSMCVADARPNVLKVDILNVPRAFKYPDSF